VEVLRHYSNHGEWQRARSEAIRAAVPVSAPDATRTPRTLPRRFAQLTNERVSALVEAYQAGDSTYQLAERFGVHRQTVAATLRRAGVTTRGHERVELTDEEHEHAQRMWDDGVSHHRIGLTLGVSERAVSRTLQHRLGKPTRQK